MSRNLIMNAIACKENYPTSSQITDAGAAKDTYLKSSFVSLVSAKKHNSGDDACLFVNFEVSDAIRALFEKEGVEIRVIPFDCFVLPPSCSWSLAYFKLCALRSALRRGEYDNYLLLDADTFVVGGFEDIWRECQDAVLLDDLHHRLSHRERWPMLEAGSHLTGGCESFTQYSGGFIASNRAALTEFMEECLSLFEQARHTPGAFYEGAGDEYILSAAAAKRRETVRSANAYIAIYWTCAGYYLVSTDYAVDPVDIWHLPAEKERVLRRLFRYYRAKGRFPPPAACARWLRLVKPEKPGPEQFILRFRKFAGAAARRFFRRR